MGVSRGGTFAHVPAPSKGSKVTRTSGDYRSMFRRKLSALGHPAADSLNLEDQNDMKVLVVWLEDQKIRHYKIEDREGLHSREGAGWNRALEKYLKDLECPYNFDVEPRCVLDWLLGVAVRYEYDDISIGNTNMKCGLDPSRSLPPTSLESGEQQKSALDIAPHDKTFAAGVREMAKIVQVTQHLDPCVLLEAVRLVIQARLSSVNSASVHTAQKKGSHMLNVTAKECGFDLGDPVLSEAAKVLRLLHIRELRDLQTQINELIVSVQAITANPKTDQSLGRVGK